MSMKDKSIRIDTLHGSLLFIGPYDDKEVSKVLRDNRCGCYHIDDEERETLGTCIICDDTKYRNQLIIEWIDEDNNDLNVLDYIDY